MELETMVGSMAKELDTVYVRVLSCRLKTGLNCLLPFHSNPRLTPNALPNQMAPFSVAVGGLLKCMVRFPDVTGTIRFPVVVVPHWASPLMFISRPAG